MNASDCEQIRQLLARYNLAIDFGDADGWAACFAPDGVFECKGVPDGSPLGGRYQGTDALRVYAETHRSVTKGRARHWNANTMIEGDGNTATMTCYLLVLTVGGPLRGVTGVYHDRLRKVDGEWRFIERSIALDAPAG